MEELGSYYNLTLDEYKAAAKFLVLAKRKNFISEFSFSLLRNLLANMYKEGKGLEGQTAPLPSLPISLPKLPEIW